MSQFSSFLVLNDCLNDDFFLLFSMYCRIILDSAIRETAVSSQKYSESAPDKISVFYATVSKCIPDRQAEKMF